MRVRRQRKLRIKLGCNYFYLNLILNYNIYIKSYIQEEHNHLSLLEFNPWFWLHEGAFHFDSLLTSPG